MADLPDGNIVDRAVGKGHDYRTAENVCRNRVRLMAIRLLRKRFTTTIEDAVRKSSLLTTDFQSLSAFRIVFAAYLLCDYWIGIKPYFEDFFSDNGVMPLAALASNAEIPVAIAISRVFEAIKLASILQVIYPVALLTFCVGYRTRMSNAAVLILNSYLFWRNPYILSGAEDLARLLLLWCLFLPMSRYWSVDAALDPQERDRPYPVLPFLALRLQITSIYLFAGIFKLTGPAWRDGSAISMALRDNLYGGMPAGLYLADHFPALLSAATYATIGIQLALPFLIYSPWHNNLTRAFTLVALAALHVSFIIFLNIGGFPFLSLSILILLVPDTWWNKLLRQRRARLARITIFHEPDCGFCRRVSLLLREFLLAPTAAVRSADTDAGAHRLLTEHNSWVVHGADGAVYLKWQAVAYVLRQSPLGAPLGWLTDLPLFRPPMAYLYDFIGNHRGCLGRSIARVFPFRSEPSISAPWEILCGTLMWFTLIGNLLTLPWIGKERIGAEVTTRLAARGQIFEALQIGQSWSLFAPSPTNYQRRYLAWADTSDGARVSLMDGATKKLFWSDDGYRFSFAAHRWLKYFAYFGDLTNEQRIALGRYLCRLSDRSRVPVRKIELVEYARSLNDVPAGTAEHTFTLSHTCGQAMLQEDR